MSTIEDNQTSWTLRGPVEGSPSLYLATFDLDAVGYTLDEYFLEGTARSFDEANPAPAAYATRIVVVRPRDLDQWSGTLFTEWLNVSGGVDGASDWFMTHRQILRSSAAWAGVSTQQVSIEGGGLLGNGPGLRRTDPERYDSLHHPGDTYSFGILADAGAALR